MKEQRTYNVGPVDLYDLSFSISVGDLNPDFRLSDAYYSNGKIEGAWLDGLGRKCTISPVLIDQLGLSSIFKEEKLGWASSVFTSRDKHQKSIATWFFLSWKLNFSYIVVRQIESSGSYCLELLSIDSGLTDFKFSNVDELMDQFPNAYVLNNVPASVIQDVLRFVMNLFGIEKEISTLQFLNNPILLSRDNHVIQINSYEKSGSAYISSWELPRYGHFKVPRIVEEKIEFERLEARIAYYRKSGYSELQSIE